jgi:hypothetical protein
MGHKENREIMLIDIKTGKERKRIINLRKGEQKTVAELIKFMILKEWKNLPILSEQEWKYLLEYYTNKELPNKYDWLRDTIKAYISFCHDNVLLDDDQKLISGDIIWFEITLPLPVAS